MSIEVKVPPLPESVADATLLAWHRKAGEPVRRDENLVDLETDKVVLEVPAPTDGVLTEIRVSDGATVAAGDVLALLEEGRVPAADAAEDAGDRNSVGESDEASRGPRPESTITRDDDAVPQKMGPAARALVEEHDLDPAGITPTGRDGRITKPDVLRYLAAHQPTNIGIDTESPTATTSSLPAGRRIERRVAMTRLRARVAERLVDAQRTAAMLTTFNEVDMSAVIALRKRYQEQFIARYGIKLGFMSFFIKAAIEGLREFPAINASVDGSDIVYHEFFDIGVAVSTDRGLLVPVVRDAENLSLAQIEEAIAEFGERARSGDIAMEDLTGGTFTITNGGIFGSMMSTPILNPPQSGILGMHAIQERPVVVDGQIVVRPMMYLALTYDHRIVDGREAVQFLVHVKQQLEDPARLVLQI